MAMFCLAMKMSVSEYKQLTLRQRNAFIDAFMERANA
jgi:hypothetical protein